MGIGYKNIEIEGNNVFHKFCRDCLNWVSVADWRGRFPQHGNTCGNCRATAKTRKPINKKVRFDVFRRDNFTCQYCGVSAPKIVLHLDHVLPISKGGDNSAANLITACLDCNLGKSDTLIE